MNRDAQDAIRGLRSASVLAILTGGALYSIHGLVSPPHGNPLVWAIAISWLIAIIVAVLTSAIFSRVNPRLFPLARWENDGEIYDRRSLRAFRWILLHSPLGWINPNLHVGASGSDCDRLLREMNAAEGVHRLS
jgi:hypothetical protein